MVEPNSLSHGQEINDEKKLGPTVLPGANSPGPCSSLTRSYHFFVCILETIFHVVSDLLCYQGCQWIPDPPASTTHQVLKCVAGFPISTLVKRKRDFGRQTFKNQMTAAPKKRSQPTSTPNTNVCGDLLAPLEQRLVTSAKCWQPIEAWANKRCCCVI